MAAKILRGFHIYSSGFSDLGIFFLTNLYGMVGHLHVCVKYNGRQLFFHFNKYHMQWTENELLEKCEV